jgi:ATP-dependent protease ClpP protease subunit
MRGMSLGGWQEQLFERRIVLVTGRLDNEGAAKAAAALLALDARGDEPVGLHLSSPDGTLGAVNGRPLGATQGHLDRAGQGRAK